MNRLDPKPCVICGTVFQPKRGRVQTCGSRSCANRLAYKRNPEPRNARRPMKRCPECLGDYRPCYATQVCCTRSCAAAYSHRRSPERRAALTAIARRGRETRRERVLAKVKGMTPEQAFQYGRRLERVYVWQRLVRQGVVEPKFTQRGGDQTRAARAETRTEKQIA